MRVCGGIVVIAWVSGCWVSGISCEFQSLRFIIRMAVLFGSSLAAIMAQCIASSVYVCLVGYVGPLLVQFKDLA